jgi:AraC-like DNA-binding protein
MENQVGSHVTGPCRLKRRVHDVGLACQAPPVTPDDVARLRRSRDTMDRDYAQPLDVAALARDALMSPGHFARSFRATFGETPYSYLMTRRIERAKALLRRGDLTVTEVCMAVGATSLGSFSARFSELVGESPSVYRARDHAATAVIPACRAKVYARPVRGRDSGRGESVRIGEAEPTADS